MRPSDFTGRHTLSGVFFDSITEKEHGDTVQKQVCRFTLDGVNYEAVEDPNDGYRSSLSDIRESEQAPEATFDGVDVLAVMKEATLYENDIIRFLNVKTGLCVLEIGTSNSGDYYPGYVAEFHPENR